ncbi:MAG: hypothetical protein C0405_14380, partial [Desulfovibrio sp.]|nr:hypothetical protein [Desulfovibrio sp.]
MSLLRRLLKPRTVQSWLEEAIQAAQGRLSLALIEGPEVLAAGGPDADLVARAPHELMTFDLVAPELRAQARLLLLPAPDADPSLCRALGALLARALHQMVQQGLALRAANAETLDQYRENALLHRAASTLNQSLLLPEVTRALLAECAGGAAGAEMGLVLAYDDELGRYMPLESFGPAAEAGLERVAAGALFLEIMERGRGEIVNDLAADPRWQNEVPGLSCLLCLPLKSAGHWAGGLVMGS